jgi:Ca2+-binding RTX toxin-like protein
LIVSTKLHIAFSTKLNRALISKNMNNNNLIQDSLLATVATVNTPTNGADNLVGTIGADNIYALDGDDTINSGLGIDFVDGGRTPGGTGGNDLLVVDYSSNTYIGNSAGIVSNVSFLDRRQYYFGSFSAVNNANGSFDRVTFTDIERFQITGTAANDFIYTGDGNDTLNGGGGNDTLKSSGGNDVINGGDGNDYIDAGSLGSYTPGTNSLSTFNTIDGGAGFDTLYEAYFAAATTNLVFNDTGATIFVGNSSISNVEGFKFLTTGSGNDSITFTKQSQNIITTGSGDDTISAGLGRDYISGGDGNDLLIVDYSSNSYVGSSPTSGITSYIGSNTPGNNSYFSAYNNNITESDKYDRVEFNGIERFQITGTSANDVIRTREGNDTLSGGDGDDYFNGGLGDDSVMGGNGNDILDGAGDRVGLDTFAGGLGNDVYGIYNSATVIIENVGEGNDTVWTVVDYNLTDHIENFYLVGNLTGNGNSRNNVIVGYGAENHIINGLGGNDYIAGGTGKDTINGGDGDDYLNGRAGIDDIRGDEGNDILDGSSGDNSIDTFAGGTGDDVYGVYNSATIVIENAGEGNDTVWTAVDYNLAEYVENLYLVGNLTGNGNSGNNVIVGYGAENHIINGLSGADYLIGGAGKDTIDGGDGADVISGGNDMDTFVCRFGQSTYLAADQIIDFSIDTDKISLFAPAGVAAFTPSSFYRANDNSTATSLQALAQAVYSDVDGTQTGNQPISIAGAALVVANGAGVAGTYLIVDDGVVGFSSNDLVINITGYNGSLPALGAISIPSFFV